MLWRYIAYIFHFCPLGFTFFSTSFLLFGSMGRVFSILRMCTGTGNMEIIHCMMLEPVDNAGPYCTRSFVPRVGRTVKRTPIRVLIIRCLAWTTTIAGYYPCHHGCRSSEGVYYCLVRGMVGPFTSLTFPAVPIGNFAQSVLTYIGLKPLITHFMFFRIPW